MKATRANTRKIVAGSVGNTLEWYDAAALLAFAVIWWMPDRSNTGD